ncbi:portal protein [Maricaulis sp.]|uniref:portal protein n=1 Tax=Maricaulis sp. TaxID=1486257 RepID=UPI0032971AD7
MKIKAPSDPGALWKDCDRAFNDRRGWDCLIKEVYDQILVYRDPDAAKGADRLNHLFDSTAVSSSMRFAGRLKNDIAPSLQTFFELELGPAAKRAVPDEAGRQELQRELSEISDAAGAAMNSPMFDGALAEMCIDLTAGQGAMLISDGDEDDPVIFEAVPAVDIALVEGRGGRVERIYYPKKWPIREIASRWPDAAKGKGQHRLPKSMMEALEKGGDDAEVEREVRQATVWDGENRRWVTSVLVQDDDGDESGVVLIFREQSRKCPWLTPRFYKIPGEVMGRGPAMMALPDVRVANKTVELTLRAAALAILGLWTRTQTMNAGGTLNLSRLAPGSMIPVQSNGGPRGPELQALDVPKNFDLSSILLNEYRERIRELLFDRPIPASKGQTPLSASQVIEHIRVYAEDLAVVYGRFVKEIIVPAVDRVIEILFNRQLLKTSVSIDQLYTALKVVSPLADAQNMKEVQRVVQWLEITGQLIGQELTAMAAKVEDLPRWLASKLGVPIDLVRNVTEKEQIEAVVAELVKAQIAKLQQQEPAAKAA